MPDETRDHRQSVTRFGVTEYTYTCERCGERMVELKCKILCPNCGACHDCSDP
jgi:exosome complex RNA-binding protein Csl4